MSLELSPLDDDHAKITKVWEKSACADPNHPQHYIEITLTPGQSLVSNEKPETIQYESFFMYSVALLPQH